MKIYIIVFSSQLIFNVLKVMEIKFTYQNQTAKLLLNSVFINLVSILSVYYSFDALLNNDFWVIAFYLFGSVLGKWIGMKSGDNPRSLIWKILVKKDKT